MFDILNGTVIISLISSLIREWLVHALLFMEKMLFESYKVSSTNNSVFVNVLQNHIENNLVSWQTKTYDLAPEPGLTGKICSGQKFILNSGLYFFWYTPEHIPKHIPKHIPEHIPEHIPKQTPNSQQISNSFQESMLNLFNLSNWLNWSKRPLGSTLFWAYLDGTQDSYTYVREGNTQITWSIRLMTFRWNIDVCRELINELQDRTYSANPSIFYFTGRNSWDRLAPIPGRDMSTVIIPKETKSLIINDLDNFLLNETRARYKKFGINYKRGIILYGPPGCGKTSLINAIASKYDMNIYIFPLDSPYITEDAFLKALLMIPGRSLLIFEDIDVAFPNRKAKEERDRQDKDTPFKYPKLGGACLTMKAFINGIDGIKSNNNGIIFMFTTNHIEHLDSALVRPGRIDLRVDLGTLKESEIRDLVRLYFNEDTLRMNREIQEAREAREVREAREEAREVKEVHEVKDLDWTVNEIACFLKDKNVIPAELNGLLLEKQAGFVNRDMILRDLLASIKSHPWNQHLQLSEADNDKAKDDRDKDKDKDKPNSKGDTNKGNLDITPIIRYIKSEEHWDD